MGLRLGKRLRKLGRGLRPGAINRGLGKVARGALGPALGLVGKMAGIGNPRTSSLTIPGAAGGIGQAMGLPAAPAAPAPGEPLPSRTGNPYAGTPGFGNM